MSRPRKDITPPDDDSELFRALSLAERLMAPREEGGTAALPDVTAPSARGTLGYWLWRVTGRRLAGGDATRVAAHYEREMARRLEALRAAGEKALARERERVAKLEKLTSRLEQAYTAEVAKLRHGAGEAGSANATQNLDRALARAAEAEDRARLAESKVEMLKEALDIHRARSGSGAPAQDDLFREAKRAFARYFHPDQGGRDDEEKRRAFTEFWPVLERIERGD